MQVRSAQVPSEALPLVPGIALIFDMDGVIINSMPLHEQSWSAYLRSLGIEPSDLAGRMHGRRNDGIVRSFRGTRTSDLEVFAHGAAKEQLFRQLMAPQLERWIVPGIREFLDSIEDVPTGVATNAERANVDFVLDGANLRHHFHVVADGSQVQHAKPAPDIYLHVADKLGIHPRNCIVFEDSTVGVAAARAAGARVVGVQTQDIQIPGMPLSGVDLLIADFNSPELTDWLAAQCKI